MNKDFKDCDIVELRANIDNWARQQGDKYLAVDARSSVTFLIAGIDANSKQSIDRDRVNTLLDAHFKNGPGFGTMRQVLADALVKEGSGGDQLSLDTNKTVLFSVKIDLQQGVTVTDAKWGQVLISGPTRIEKEDVSDADIARFEFEQANFTRLDQAIDHDSILMVAFASTLARERSWLSVGGSYVPMHLYSNMQFVTLPRSIHSSDLNGENWEYISGFQMTSDTCYRIDERGTRYKMERVSKFKLDKKAKTNQAPKLQI
jgi:hypothetical protein